MYFPGETIPILIGSTKLMVRFEYSFVDRLGQNVEVFKETQTNTLFKRVREGGYYASPQELPQAPNSGSR